MKLFLILILVATSTVYAGGSVSGQAGTTSEDEKVVVQPSGYSVDEDDLKKGQDCLTKLNPNLELKGKALSVEFLKKEISLAITKPMAKIGRAIASVEDSETSFRPVSCSLFARALQDPRFTDLIVPKITKPLTEEVNSPSGTVAR